MGLRLILACWFAILGGVIPGQDIAIGSNTILVDHSSFDKAIMTLVNRGYILDKMDKGSRAVVTKFKDVPRSICHMSISLRMALTNFQGFNALFNEMNDFAKSLKGKLRYAKR
jgi:hypothetical protein